MVWIRTISPADATGRLKEAYDWQASRLGKPTEFTQLGSLDPEVVHARLVLYRATENVTSKLTFRQRELISYLTSILNSTPHCASLQRRTAHRSPAPSSARPARTTSSGFSTAATMTGSAPPTAHWRATCIR